MADPVRTESDGETRTGEATGGVENLGDLAAQIRADRQAEEAQANAVIERQQRDEQRAAEEDAADAVGQFVDLLKTGRDMAGDMLEEAGTLPVGRTAEIWSDERIGKIAQPLLGVIVASGGDIGKWLERFGPHLMLAVAVFPPAVETIRAVRRGRAAKPITTDGQQQPT